MNDQGLSSSVLQSDRTGNSFMAMLLFHHFLNHDDLIWLITFEHHNLAGDEMKAMISDPEVGAINNTTFRSLNRECDTLSASKHLRRLVDFWLLDKKGGGSGMYYVPSAKAPENWPASVQASGKSTELESYPPSFSNESRVPAANPTNHPFFSWLSTSSRNGLFLRRNSLPSLAERKNTFGWSICSPFWTREGLLDPIPKNPRIPIRPIARTPLPAVCHDTPQRTQLRNRNL